MAGIPQGTLYRGREGMWSWVAHRITGVLIFQRNTWGLWLGVGFAGLSAMLTVIVMFVFPLWAPACGWPSRPGGDEPLSSPGSPGRARCRGGVLALVGPIWAQLPGTEASRGWAGGRRNAALIRRDNPTLTCRAGEI